MTIQVTMYDTRQLLGLYREQAPVQTYFRQLAFPQVLVFDDEYVDFEKIREGRKLAPLVLPTAQGRPVYSQAATAVRIKPAYVKPKDPISPSRLMKRMPGEGLVDINSMTPAQRFTLLLADILRVHRETIDRREEWMAAQALIYGKVTLADPDYPTRVVDFQRAADHTVTLTGAQRWGQAGIEPMDDIQAWVDRVRRAPFGGPTNRLTVGANVLKVLLASTKVKEQLDLQTRGTNADLNTGLRSGEYVEYIGKLGPNLELWVNTDYYEQPDGTAVPFMDPDGVLLTGPNVQGVRCFGAILDDEAGYRALAAFPKQWRQPDPSAVFVMTQSAPLPVPVNPNNSLYAKVL
jgi:hypothetical protein